MTQDDVERANKKAKELIREVAPIAANEAGFQSAVFAATEELNNRLPEELRGLFEPEDVARWLRNATLMDERTYYKLKILQLKDEISYCEYVLENLEMEKVEGE